MTEEAFRKRRLVGGVFGGVIFLACTVFIAFTFDFEALLQGFGEVRAGLFFGGSIASLLTYWWLRALRWRSLLVHSGVRAGLGDIYLISAVCLGFANFTPFQSGEALKVEMLRKATALDRAEGYGGFFVEKILDLGVLLALGVVGTAGGLGLWAPEAFYGLLAVMVLVGLACGWAVFRLELPGAVGRIAASMRSALASPAHGLWLLIITMGSWLAAVLGWQAVFWSAGLELGLYQTAALMSGLTLLAVLSLIPGGMGVAEVAASEVLVQMGHSEALAQLGAVLIRGYALVGLVLALAHFGVWRWSARREATPEG